MINYLKIVKEFLIKNRNYIFTTIWFLIFFIITSLFLPISEDLKNTLIKQITEYVSTIQTNNNLVLMWRIFLNNSFVSLLIVLFWFLLSIWWIFMMFSNVFITWLVLNISIEKIWLAKSLLAILPHGIIEISAILLSVALWFKITVLTVKKIWNWKKTSIKNELKEILVFYWSVILPLLLVAAFIESFITPLFLK